MPVCAEASKISIQPMLNRLITLIAAACIVAAIPVFAQQQFVWSIDAGSVFENREGDDYYSPDQTITFTRLSPEVGISLMGGKHRIMGGVSWYQPLGNEWDGYKLSPTVYYRYVSPSWRISLGMLPRTQLIEQLPTVLMSDSLRYTEPNIRGALIQYVNNRGFMELALDWRSLQTATQREAFSVYFHGRWNPVWALMVGGRLQVNHLAKTSEPTPGQNVNDDIAINPYVGLDLGKYTPQLDSLTIKAGLMLQLERDRGNGIWHKPYGLMVDATAEWRFLGIDEHIYVGKNLFPLYHKYGHLLNMGDPSYQAKVYSRTNIRAYIFRNQFMNLYASLDFHYTPDAFTFWQKIALRVYIDNNLWNDRRKKVAHNQYLSKYY